MRDSEVKWIRMDMDVATRGKVTEQHHQENDGSRILLLLPTRFHTEHLSRTSSKYNIRYSYNF